MHDHPSSLIMRAEPRSPKLHVVRPQAGEILNGVLQQGTKQRLASQRGDETPYSVKAGEFLCCFVCAEGL